MSEESKKAKKAAKAEAPVAPAVPKLKGLDERVSELEGDFKRMAMLLSAQFGGDFATAAQAIAFRKQGKEA